MKNFHIIILCFILSCVLANNEAKAHENSLKYTLGGGAAEAFANNIGKKKRGPNKNRLVQVKNKSQTSTKNINDRQSNKQDNSIYFYSATATAADTEVDNVEVWKVFEQDGTTNAKVCPTDVNKPCFHLRCSSEGILQFVLASNISGSSFSLTDFTVLIDGKAKGQLNMSLGVNGHGYEVNYVQQNHDAILSGLKSGRRLVLRSNDEVTYSLKGSAEAIKKVVSLCKNKDGIVATNKPFNLPAKPSMQIHELKGFRLFGKPFETSRNSPRLANLLEDDCIRICLYEPRCVVAEYDKANQKCALKDTAGERVYAPEINSTLFENKPTLRRVAPTRIASVTEAENFRWKTNDTKESFVARLREAARPYGDSCSADREDFDGAVKTVSVSKTGQILKTGTTLDLKWNDTGGLKKAPVYLIISTNRPVRFRGLGFYALLPEAIAPFGIDFDENRSRAIVALHGADALKAGEVQIEPISPGQIEIRYAVVGYQRACAEVQMSEVTTETYSVLTNAQPEIIVHSDFAKETDEFQFIAASNNRRLLAVGQKEFRLLSGDGRDLILKLDGEDAKFSPTGRFVIVRRKGATEFIDAEDGAALFVTGGRRISGPDRDIAWAANDSFAVTGSSTYGSVDVLFMLTPDKAFAGDGGRARIARGFVTTKIAIDLENDAIIFAAAPGMSDTPETSSGFHKLTSPIARGSDQTQGPQILFGLENVTAIKIPEEWTPRGPLQFTHVLSSYAEIIGDEEFERKNKVPADNLVSQKVVEMATLGAGVSNSNLGIPVEWRSRSTVETDETARVNFWGVAESLGLETIAIATPVFDKKGYINWNDENSDRSIADKLGREVARRIIQDMPWAKKNFIEEDKNEVVEYCRKLNSRGEHGDQLWKRLNQAKEYSLAGRKLWFIYLNCSEGSGRFDNSTLAIFDTGKPGAFVEPDMIFVDRAGVECDEIIHCPHEVAVTENGLALFHSTATQAFAIYDTRSHKTIYKKRNLPGGEAVAEVRITKDEKHVVQRNTDGTIYVHRMRDDKVVLTGRYIDDEIVIWNRNLEFVATPEGAYFINLKFPGQVGLYNLQLFKNRLERPDLVKDVLGGHNKLHKIEVSAPPRLSGTIKLDSDQNLILDLYLEGNAAVTSLRVFQDGLLTNRILVQGKEARQTFEVNKVPNARWVALQAEDVNGLVSVPIGRYFEKAAEPTQVNMLVIGVDNYSDPKLQDLNFAKTDALLVADAIREGGGNALAVRQFEPLGDESATQSNILNSIDNLLAETTASETAVLFFAGHGLRDENGEFYLGLSDTKATDIAGTALAWREVAKRLSFTKGRVIVFLDACHSGVAGTDIFATNDQAANRLAQSVPSGLTIFSASKGREVSGESSSIGAGYFSLALSKVISAERSSYDLNKNGRIEISELYRGVKSQVVLQRDGLQTPWMVRNEMVGEFSIF